MYYLCIVLLISKNMKFTKRGKKKFTLETELSKGFVARVTENRLDLESISKSWKISFSKSTTEYAYALYLLQHNNVNELALATAMLFNCTRVFTDAEMLKVVMTAMQKVDEKCAKNMAKQSAKEDDSEILDNEALLQASIEENAATKSGKKAVKKIMKNK